MAPSGGTKVKCTLAGILLLLISNLSLAEEWSCPVTYRGKPAVGAKVVMIPVTYAPPPRAGKPTLGTPVFTTTDAKGIAKFAKPGDGAGRMFARDAQGR